MKEDDIERVCDIIFDHFNRKNNLKFKRGTLCIIYRSTTGNYSATAFREFIITLKSMEILNEIKQGLMVFNPEKFGEYKKFKEDLK